MFSIFKKKAKNDPLIDHFDELYSFSSAQKEAVLVSLYEVATSDEEFHDKEDTYFNKISGMMGVYYSKRKLRKLMKRKDSIYPLMKDFSEVQKDWYVFTVLGMVYADGKIIDEEFDRVKEFLLKLGFTEERIQRNLVQGQYFE